MLGQGQAKRTRKSTQVTAVLANELVKIAGQTDSQVDTSLARYLCIVLWRLPAKRNRKSARTFTQIVKGRKFQAYTVDLCRLALVGRTVKNVRRLAYEFELDPSQCKST